MIAFVYKQAYEYYPNNKRNFPILVKVKRGDMFTTVACQDCDGTGDFEMPDGSFETCVYCKGTGKNYVTLY